MNDINYILHLLSVIEPEQLTYEEWYIICKALKTGGCPFSMWQNFCDRDIANPRTKNCKEIWNSVDNSFNYMAFAEIRKIAKRFGWKDSKYLDHHYIDADGDIAIPYVDYLPGTAIEFPTNTLSVNDEVERRFVPAPKIPNHYKPTDFLINNLLPEASTILITAIPKAGKSLFTQQMAVCIAAGISFLGHACKKGKVLYIDAENKMYDSYERIKKIASQLNVDINVCENIVFYDKNLIPYGVDVLEDLTQIIKPGQFDVIILDPIYFVFNGDENSTKEVNTFIKKIDDLSKAANASVVMIHHETKGGRFTKNIVDRAAGSNIFSRFPVAVISISPIKAKKNTIGLREKLEIVLRFDKSPEPMNIVLNDGIHRKENDIEATEGTAKLSSKTSIDNKNQKLINAYNTLRESCETVKATDLAEYLNVARTSIYNYIKNTPGFTIEKGIIIKSECND